MSAAELRSGDCEGQNITSSLQPLMSRCALCIEDSIILMAPLKSWWKYFITADVYVHLQKGPQQRDSGSAGVKGL